MDKKLNLKTLTQKLTSTTFYTTTNYTQHGGRHIIELTSPNKADSDVRITETVDVFPDFLESIKHSCSIRIVSAFYDVVNCIDSARCIGTSLAGLHVTLKQWDIVASHATIAPIKVHRTDYRLELIESMLFSAYFQATVEILQYLSTVSSVRIKELCSTLFFLQRCFELKISLLLSLFKKIDLRSFIVNTSQFKGIFCCKELAKYNGKK